MRAVGSSGPVGWFRAVWVGLTGVIVFFTTLVVEL